MKTRAIISILVSLVAGLALVPPLAAAHITGPVSRTVPRHPSNCLAFTVVSCPSDLRAVRE
jgi:hypothetical protein